MGKKEFYHNTIDDKIQYYNTEINNLDKLRKEIFGQTQWFDSANIIKIKNDLINYQNKLSNEEKDLLNFKNIKLEKEAEITALEIERLLLQIDLFKAKIGLKGNGVAFDLGAKAGDWARQQYRSFVGLPNDSPKPYVAPKKDTAFVPYRQSSLMNNTIPNYGSSSSNTIPATVTINNVHIKDGKAFSDNATITMKNLNSF